MGHRVAPRAEADLDEIWLHIARESGSIEVADRTVDLITDRFFTLGSFPHIGRLRDHDLGDEYRSLPVGDYVIVYRVEEGDIHVLRVVHGRRDLERLFGR